MRTNEFVIKRQFKNPYIKFLIWSKKNAFPDRVLPYYFDRSSMEREWWWSYKAWCRPSLFFVEDARYRSYSAPGTGVELNLFGCSFVFVGNEQVFIGWFICYEEFGIYLQE
tara:strand:+ start:164 stop:496 length:333 start_codon:yes stop_codon:yes gene_type:complete